MPDQWNLRNKFLRSFKETPSHREPKWSIILKTLLPLGITVFLTALAFYGFILPRINSVLMEEKQVQVRNLTKTVIELAKHYHERVISGELTEENSQKRLLERIRFMRYGDDGKEYFWVHDINYHMLMHPYMPELEGTDMIEYEDPEGNRMIYEMVETVKESGNGYVEYMWPLRDNVEIIEEKLSYVELFEPWDWVIGTGIYYDDINESIGRIIKRTNRVLTAIFLTILAISFYILIRNIRLEEKRTAIEEERITLIKNLRETNKKLETTKNELQEAHKAKDMFLANISHDLRTPLNGILGFSKLIEESSPKDRQELFDEYVVYIEKSGKYLLNMINDILDLSKMQAGKSVLEKTIFNLNALLSDVIQSLSYFALEKHIELSLNTHEDSRSTDPLFVEADQTLLNKVFYNLLSNAIKYTPEGKKAGIILKETKENLIIQVWDQGIGIPKEAQKRVFEPFVQLNNIKCQGTGLGLTISENIVTMHGGTLTLESVEGEGSEFSVYLPASIQREPIDEATTKQPKSFHFSGKQALIVEDDPISRRFMMLYLKKHGFEVKGTDSGQEALTLAKQKNFDIILMDIQLPDMNGKELLQKIETLFKEKPFIAALTAYSGEKAKEAIKKAGFDNIFSKPVDTQRLLARLHEVLNKPAE